MIARVLAAGLTASLAIAIGAAAPRPVAAQGTDGEPRQVISANPFGLLLEFFNAEYERAVTPSSTAGIGGSTFSADDDTYINADAFWRYYPQGDALDGWAFGVKLGVTSVDDASYFGYGFDVNRSWVLGASNNFYVGIGVGLKRLVGGDGEDFDLEYIPTIRIVNVGIAF
jgi:hypothetical protein